MSINLISTTAMPTGASTLTITDVFNSDFLAYRLVFGNIGIATAANNDLFMTLTVSGTADSDAADYSSMWIRGSGGFDESDFHDDDGSSGVGIKLNQESLGGTSGAQYNRWAGVMDIFGSQEARYTQTLIRSTMGSGNDSGDSNGGHNTFGAGTYKQTAVVDGFKLTATNGENFAQGKVSIYGIT